MSDKNQPEIVRAPEQLQQAHDILTFVIRCPELQEDLLGDDPLREATVASMKSTRDLLCWLLGHDDYTFVTNMVRLEAALINRGFELKDLGRLVAVEDDDGPLPS